MKPYQELGCSAQYRHKWCGKAGSDEVAELTNSIKSILGRQTKSDCEELPNVVVELSDWARKRSDDI